MRFNVQLLCHSIQHVKTLQCQNQSVKNIVLNILITKRLQWWSVCWTCTNCRWFEFKYQITTSSLKNIILYYGLSSYFQNLTEYSNGSIYTGTLNYIQGLLKIVWYKEYLLTSTDVECTGGQQILLIVFIACSWPRNHVEQIQDIPIIKTQFKTKTHKHLYTLFQNKRNINT